jgi:hypothetical protein
MRERGKALLLNEPKTQRKPATGSISRTDAACEADEKTTILERGGTMKVIRDRIAHWSLVGLLLAFAATSFYAPSASAHGEKSQAAFMRMRTIHWFDLHWSKEKVPVNEFVDHR